MTEIVQNEIAGTGVYEDRLLAFLDILGFSNLIKGSVNQRSLARKLLDLFTSLNRLFSHFISDDFAITLFSDTVCISSRNPLNVVSFCCGLSAVVTSFLGLGYPVRGAVSRDLLYHNGNTIFGPCLVRAYNLEHRLAFFPRIIIDPKLRIEDPSIDQTLLQPVYTDLDGLRCVNFLSPVLVHVTFRLLGLPTEDLLSEIVANVDRMIAGVSDEAALQKLHWLRAYVQRMVNETIPSTVLIDELVRKAREGTA
jgi:hypothetical protein